MATISLVIDQRRENRDNTYPLVFRIYVNGKTRDLPTEVYFLMGLGTLMPLKNSSSVTLSRVHILISVLSSKLAPLSSLQ